MLRKNIVKKIIHRPVLESDLETTLVEAVKSVKGMCVKLTLPYDSSWPDRLLMLSGGVTWWIELKRPGNTPEKLQKIRRAWLKANNHCYVLLDDWEKLQTFIRLHVEPHRHKLITPTIFE